jgi:hypothetical protein
MNDLTDTYLSVATVIVIIFIFLVCLICNISNLVYDNHYVEID